MKTQFGFAMTFLVAILVSSTVAQDNGKSAAYKKNESVHTTKTTSSATGIAPEETSPKELFESRIMPIFRSEKPSSCVQCHLASVDLKNYIRPSHAETFASLRDQGLIDLDEPRKSKILELIEMGDKDWDKGAKLIHEKMRKAEHEAFATWIEACCADEDLVKLPTLEETKMAKPEAADAVIRHARKNRVMNSFVRNVWSQRMRCFPCHTPGDIKPNQKAALKKYEQFEAQYGEIMEIFKETPIETMQYLIDNSRNKKQKGLPLLNLDDPAKSLLVLKPTAKLPKKGENGKFLPPSYDLPVSHMGGLKMHRDDQSYKSFIAWIQDYSNVVNAKYTDVKDLPADNWFATRKILRVKEMPESYEVGTPVQMFVFQPDDQGGWGSEPVAFTQGTITPRRIVNGALFLLAPEDQSKRPQWRKQKKLAPGKYMVKVYIDRDGKLAKQPEAMLSENDFAGQVTISKAQWRLGFPKAETVSAAELKK